MAVLGTTLNMSTAYHPHESDGQTERANRTSEDVLRGFVGPRQDDWCKCLALAEFAYNNSVQLSTQHTPFFLNLERHPAKPRAVAVPHRTNNPAVSDLVQSLQRASSSAKSKHLLPLSNAKLYADRKRKDHPFQVGDQVLLQVRQNQLPLGLSSKLSARFSGPFPIVAAVGSQAFRRDLPATVRINPVFHVSQLKPYVAFASLVTDSTNPGPLYADKRGDVYAVESVLAKKERKKLRISGKVARLLRF